MTTRRERRQKGPAREADLAKLMAVWAEEEEVVEVVELACQSLDGASEI